MENFSKNGVLVVLIGLIGIVICGVSAFYFSTTFLINSDLTPEQQLLLYVPGLVFGLAVATIYVCIENRFALRLLGIITIPLQGLITYQIAYVITHDVVFWIGFFSGSHDNTDTTLFVTPFVAMIGAFVATFLFVLLLQILSKKYSLREQIRLSLYGGLFGALLIDAVLLSKAIPGPTIGKYIFFIGWQTVMLLLVSMSLLKKFDEHIERIR